MKTTMNLLDEALEIKPIPFWTEKLNLYRTTLNTARTRGHLSPAIAGALAEELGKDVREWIVVAALESEKESACKSRMIKKIQAVPTWLLAILRDIARGRASLRGSVCRLRGV